MKHLFSILLLFVFGIHLQAQNNAKVKKWMNSAYIHLDNKDYSDAIKLLNKVLKKEPQNSLALNNRAFGLLMEYPHTKTAEKVMPDLARALSKYPENCSYLDTKAIALHYLGRSEEAIEILSSCIQKSPDVPTYYNTRGFIHHQNGEKQKAQQDWQSMKKHASTYFYPAFEYGD